MSLDLYVGRLLDNRYQVGELIRKEARGNLYRGEDQQLGDTVAIKFLSRNLLDQKSRDRFWAEARLCGEVSRNSSQIVRVLNAGSVQCFETGGFEEVVPFYVMEFLQGVTLKKLILSQPLPLTRFFNLAQQICMGLQSIHAGTMINGQKYPVVHRDIKPKNIIVVPGPNSEESVKIVGFDVAKVIFPDSDVTTAYLGTLAYSSPEQMEGHTLDGRSDIYSMGVTMFQMLTGKLPWQVEPPSFGNWYKAHHFQSPCSFEETNASVRVPRALEALVMQCLAKAASDRPRSIVDVLNALQGMA